MYMQCSIKIKRKGELDANAKPARVNFIRHEEFYWELKYWESPGESQKITYLCIQVKKQLTKQIYTLRRMRSLSRLLCIIKALPLGLNPVIPYGK